MGEVRSGRATASLANRRRASPACRLLAGALALATLACGGSGEELLAARPAPDPTVPATGLPKVVFLGDSLTAGLSLEVEEAFPARLADLLAAAGSPVEAVNAGISGDTSAGGLARIDWLLQQKPDIVVVELGVNDGLRGIAPSATEANLREILKRVRAAGAEALLLGMRLPPSYGLQYVGAFEKTYPRLAEELDVSYVPFFLDGIAGHPELNLSDGIHPNAAGHARAAENVLPHLRSLLDAL